LLQENYLILLHEKPLQSDPESGCG